MKLWLVRSKANYLNIDFVAVPDKKSALAAGEKIFRFGCTVSEVKVPGFVIRVEREPVQGKLFRA